MRWARPKSLYGLMMFGLLLIAVPLLFAVVNAAIQMRRLAASSQQLVVKGVEATRLTQSMFTSITSLERATRYYLVLGDRKFLDTYHQADARLANSRRELRARLGTDIANTQLDELETLQLRAKAALESAQLGAGADLQTPVDRLYRMTDLANEIANSANRQIDADLSALDSRTRDAQQWLLMQTALLVPFSLLAILLLAFSIGRPLRQIDRAISELGRGAFNRSIEVSGPTDIERLGRQLEWLRQRLVDLAQERNRFLRHMSHELKTPLANIREGTELLMDGAVGELDSSQREVTTILRDNGIRLQRLIENLLSFSAWQSQRTDLELTEFRARSVVKQVLENQQLTLLSQRLRLDVAVEDVTVYADRGKVRLILENLLSNAIKYSPRGGTVHLFVKAAGEVMQIEVADQGQGIPKEERERIFDAFYTGKAPTGGHLKGTGIGLSVVLEFTHAHGGTVEIVDGTYSGAHFRVRLPLRTQAKSAARAEAAHAA
ncbi:MAG: ATP-binding protein [Steroidobacteraceae bacterium]